MSTNEWRGLDRLLELSATVRQSPLSGFTIYLAAGKSGVLISRFPCSLDTGWISLPTIPSLHSLRFLSACSTCICQYYTSFTKNICSQLKPPEGKWVIWLFMNFWGLGQANCLFTCFLYASLRSLQGKHRWLDFKFSVFLTMVAVAVCTHQETGTWLVWACLSLYKLHESPRWQEPRLGPGLRKWRFSL